jgi:hypothetical protein
MNHEIGRLKARVVAVNVTTPEKKSGRISKHWIVQLGLTQCYGMRTTANAAVALSQNLDLAPESKVIFASEILQETKLDEPLCPVRRKPSPVAATVQSDKLFQCGPLSAIQWNEVHVTPSYQRS